MICHSCGKYMDPKRAFMHGNHLYCYQCGAQKPTLDLVVIALMLVTMILLVSTLMWILL